MTARLGLPDVDTVATWAQDVLPAAVLHLAALQSAVAGRLASTVQIAPLLPPPATNGAPDVDLLTSAEAAAVLKVSRKWLYRHAHRLPFARRLSRHELRFSRRGLEEHLARCRA